MRLASVSHSGPRQLLLPHTGASHLCFMHMEICRACVSSCVDTDECTSVLGGYALGSSLGILSSYLCPQLANRLWFLAATRLSPSTPGSICPFLALVPAGHKPPPLSHQEAWGGGQGQAEAGPELMANFPGRNRSSSFSRVY